MAELTIQLRTDPNTGKKDVRIALRSDPDALPHEHEQHHRQLVEKLLEKGLLKADELGEVIVEREEVGAAPQTTPESTGAAQGRAAAQGG